jgi:hypothetical protein
VEHIDVVRAINFQPATWLAGRFPIRETIRGWSYFLFDMVEMAMAKLLISKLSSSLP